MTNRSEFVRRHVATICDDDYTPIGRLRDWDSMESVDVFADVGVGKLDCASSDHNMGLLREGRTIVVRDKDQVVSFGPIEFGRDQRGDTISMPVDWKNGTTYLNERLVYIDPRTAPNGVLSREFYERTGLTSTVIMQTVNDNLGPAAMHHRRVPGFVMGDDPGAGVMLKAPVQARFDDKVLPFVRPLAITGGVSFWVELVDRALVFRCEQVTNRAASVQFSAQMHGIGDMSAHFGAPSATALVAGGDGQGIEQPFIEVQSPEGLADERKWRRIEEFFSGRADGESLEAAALRDLAGRSAVVTAEFTPAGSALKYGKHYALGDLVTCVLWPGMSVVMPVREVRRSVSVNGGVRITPTAGDYSDAPDGFTSKQLQRVVDSLKRR